MNESIIQRAVELNDPALAKEALREIKSLLRTSSDHNERGYLLFSLASCYGIVGNFDEARRQLYLALREASDGSAKVTFDFMQALLFQREGRYEEAFEQFSFTLRAHRQQWDQPELRFMYEDIQQRRGFLLVTLNRFKEAIPILTETLLFSPEEHRQEIHLYLGICYDQLGESTLAKEEYLKAIAHNLGSSFETEARYRLALLHFNTGGFAQAKLHLESLVHRDNSDLPNIPLADVYEQLSHVYRLLGDAENSKKYLEAANMSRKS